MKTMNSYEIRHRRRRWHHTPVALVLVVGTAMVVPLLYVPIASMTVASAAVAPSAQRAGAPLTTEPDGSGLYHPMTPVRLVDTRCAALPEPSFCAGEKLPSANAGLGTLQAGSAGPSWSQPALIDANGGGLTSVSCPSSSFCVAVGGGDALTWNGTSWSQPVPIDPNGYGHTSVSCPSSSFCVAVDSNGNAVIGRS